MTSRPLEVVLERIGRRGPLPFEEVVDLALYGEGGFFSSGGGAGRRADFLTSPEVGPLFGAVLARALDAEWERLGRSDPFVVVEAGAGRGALAAAVLAAAPGCSPALRYLCVERSAVLRARVEEVVAVEPPDLVLGAVTLGGDDDEGPTSVPGTGPLVTVLDDLPAVSLIGVVVANELLDNLPFGLLERTVEGWSEVRVGDGLVEVLVPAPPGVVAEAEHLAPGATAGSRIPLQHQAGAWLRRALDLVERGRVLVIDYADTTPSMGGRPQRDWLRTYRGHGRGGAPLDALGEQDVTCEVAVDQLPRPDVDRSQAGWLVAHGLGDLVAEARATWHERAHLGDLQAMKARSRVSEAAALTDPHGLGAFRVLEWQVGR